MFELSRACRSSFAKERTQLLLDSIAGSYKRQATNRDPIYRRDQMKKVKAWLEELSEIFESEPKAWL